LSKQVTKKEALTKGERTAKKILDVAELRFAEKGFEKTNVREIAEQVGRQEPGLYRHVANKQQLYSAVLPRALITLEKLLNQSISQGVDKKSLIELPVKVFDLFIEHPSMAFLFQQAMLTEKSEQNQMHRWIDTFFKQENDLSENFSMKKDDQQMLAIKIIALFNVCIGFFTSQKILQ